MKTTIFWVLPIALLAAITPAAAQHAPAQATLRINLSDVKSSDKAAVDRRISRSIRDFCRNDVAHLDLAARRAERACARELQAKAAIIAAGQRTHLATAGL